MRLSQAPRVLPADLKRRVCPRENTAHDGRRLEAMLPEGGEHLIQGARLAVSKEAVRKGGKTG